jgi:hypothetical protein
MVPKERFELSRPYGHYALNVARLPFRHFGVKTIQEDYTHLSNRASREGDYRLFGGCFSSHPDPPSKAALLKLAYPPHPYGSDTSINFFLGMVKEVKEDKTLLGGWVWEINTR